LHVKVEKFKRGVNMKVKYKADERIAELRSKFERNFNLILQKWKTLSAQDKEYLVYLITDLYIQLNETLKDMKLKR